jgi:flavin reductase (DIM6/NTAB) family NADH-FMN oxidoreductase RutF
MTIFPKDTTQQKLHQILLGSVSPRPIAFASTVDASGNPNLAPYSFFNVFSSNPPILVFSPSRRGRDNTTKHTLDNIRDVPEAVINIVNHRMVEQMSLASAEYPKGVNEFVKAGFTPLKSDTVKPFRVAESPVQIECKVNQIIELGTAGGAGNLIIAEVTCIHADDAIFDADGRIDPAKIDQVARMGGQWYSRAKAGLFQLPQPTTQIGIGFDQLPLDIKNSEVLTGNQLGLLAGIEHLPDETAVNEFKLTELADLFIAHEDHPAELERALHAKAAQYLDERKTEEAWLTLLSFNNRI